MYVYMSTCTRLHPKMEYGMAMTPVHQDSAMKHTYKLQGHFVSDIQIKVTQLDLDTKVACTIVPDVFYHDWSSQFLSPKSVTVIRAYKL